MFRSVLFIPCANAKAMTKAATLACDALIFDLEDAVGDAEFDNALSLLGQTLKGPFQAQTILVRIQPLYAAEILAALASAFAANKIQGIVIPKVYDFEDIRRHHALLDPTIGLWAMIETAAGIANLATTVLMARDNGLKGLVAGPNDLRKDLRTRPMADRQDILFALSQIVLYGRAHGLTVLDGVYNQFRDEAGFMAECAQGRSLGFDGKTLIHPAQIAACEAAFSPSEAEIEWAKAVVAAFEGSAAGVVSVDGEMVERLHLEQARIILG